MVARNLREISKRFLPNVQEQKEGEREIDVGTVVVIYISET